MLFNIDRDTKNNLLQMYKKEAEDFNTRKQADRQKKIMEERDYLRQYEQRENALEDRLRLEKVRKINENMDGYQKMLQTQTTRHKSRIEDVKINGYGYNIAGANSFNNTALNKTYAPEQSHYQQNQPQNQILQPQQEYQMNPIENRDRRSYPPRESDMIRREDHMGNYLTDKVNEGELKTYFQNQKYEHMKYYKDLLDNQCSQRKNSPQVAGNINVTNANIINHQKRFNLANDPYNMKKNTGFGKSFLERNPITNPVNNMEYNKYLNFMKNEEQGQGQQGQEMMRQDMGMEQGRPLPQQYQQQQLQPQQWNDYPSNNNNNQGNHYTPNQNYNDYQPYGGRDQYIPNNNINNYHDYNNPPQMDNYQPRYQQQQPYDYQDIQMPMQPQQQLPYTLSNNISPPQSLPTQPSNAYQKEIVPTPSGQRLIAAGASSFLRK